jgi:hypothetical protein
VIELLETDSLSVGVDWGAVTGVAAWSHCGIVMALQGDQLPMLRILCDYLRAHNDRVRILTLEAAFKGSGGEGSKALPAALSSVAQEHFTKGVLWRQGFDMKKVWNPTPSEWRKVQGFTGGTTATGEKPNREEYELRARLWAAPLLKVKELPKSQTHKAEALGMANAGWNHWWGQKLAMQTTFKRAP